MQKTIVPMSGESILSNSPLRLDITLSFGGMVFGYIGMIE